MNKIKKHLNLGNERGNILVYALVLLLVGSLLIVPTVSLMATGIHAGQDNEEQMKENYAADAGVEYAIIICSIILITARGWRFSCFIRYKCERFVG